MPSFAKPITRSHTSQGEEVPIPPGDVLTAHAHDRRYPGNRDSLVFESQSTYRRRMTREW